MDPKNTVNTDNNTKTSAPAEIHTSVEEAKKAEETARQERIEDKQAELNAHNEANLFKKEIEHEDKK